MTESWLVSELAGLSDTQLNWRAAEGKWSIAEIVAHLAIAEPQYWDQVKQSMAKPVEEGFKPKATDAGILWSGPHAAEQDRRSAHSARRMQERC